MTHLEKLKSQRLQLANELHRLRPEQEVLRDIHNSGEIGKKMTTTRRGLARQASLGGFNFSDHLHEIPQNLRQEISERDRLEDAIRSVERQISIEEKKQDGLINDAHKKRREIMADRHKQLMRLLDKMDQTKLAQGASAIQIEQEKTRRAQISREIQSLINENDNQDRAELDGLFNELKTLAVGGLGD